MFEEFRPALSVRGRVNVFVYSTVGKEIQNLATEVNSIVRVGVKRGSLAKEADVVGKA